MPVIAAAAAIAYDEGMADLRDSERRLLHAIARVCRERGQARSLFGVAVLLAGLEYRQAHRALAFLEIRKLVRVERRGPGRPLVMRIIEEET